MCENIYVMMVTKCDINLVDNYNLIIKYKTNVIIIIHIQFIQISQDAA